MGLFSSKKKKQKENMETNNEANTVQETKKAKKKAGKLNTHTERLSFIKDNCDAVVECSRQIEEAKVEYQAVTSYLTDMQRIDRIPLDEREDIEDAARKIINLTKERNKFHQKEKVITDQQYNLFESFETQIPKELPLIKENEELQVLIKKDMENLEKEKDSLLEEQEDIISKQGFLRGLAIMISIIVIALFSIFAYLSESSSINITFPFILTVLMGMGLGFYVFKEARKNSTDIKLVQAKQNRQITLMNKVKIKSVNNRNYLDYAYNKYMVESYAQFKTLWEEYVVLKDEANRYKNNTELMEFYQNELISGLRKFSVADSEIWIYQPTALLDNKEMVEVRHRLNVRRQKLRERIDLTMAQRNETVKSMNYMIKDYPSIKQDAINLMKQYQIQPQDDFDDIEED